MYLCENCMGHAQWDNFIDQEVAWGGVYVGLGQCMKIQRPRSGLRVCVRM